MDSNQRDVFDEIRQDGDKVQDLIGRNPRWLGILSIILPILAISVVVLLASLMENGGKSLLDILLSPFKNIILKIFNI